MLSQKFRILHEWRQKSVFQKHHKSVTQECLAKFGKHVLQNYAKMFSNRTRALYHVICLGSEFVKTFKGNNFGPNFKQCFVNSHRKLISPYRTPLFHFVLWFHCSEDSSFQDWRPNLNFRNLNYFFEGKPVNF